MTLAKQIFDTELAVEKLHDTFVEKLLNILNLEEWPFEDFDFDSYDNSFELHGCNESLELTKEQQNMLWEEGFDCCWLNYPNKTERYYSKLYSEGKRK